MLKPHPMLQIRVVLLKKAERTVLWSLGQQNILHLNRIPVEPDTAPLPSSDVKTELEHCNGLSERCNKLKQLLDQFEGQRLDRKPDDTSSRPSEKRHQLAALQNLTTLEAIEIALHSIETQAVSHFDNHKQLVARKNELDAACNQVAGFRELDVPLDQLDQFSFLHFITGNIPEGRPPINMDMQKGNTLLLPLPGNEGRTSLLILTTPRNRQHLEHQLQQIDFRQESFPALTGLTANGLYMEHDKERRQIEQSLQQAEAQISAFASETEYQLVALREQLILERQLIEAKQYFSRTENTLLLAGWIPADSAPDLKQNLEAITQGRCVIEFTSPEESPSAQVPVLLRHNGWLHPFQKMVSAYGLPEYCELEPTLFVAISYIVMFGMMFGDAGQGVTLAIAGTVAIFACRTEALRDAGRLLLTGGLSSIFFGVLYGSYFGIPNLKKFALWRDPLEGDPLKLMTGAITLGVVVISMGLILNVINRFRRKDVLEGLFGQFGLIGILFYWGSLTLLNHHDVFTSHHLLWLFATIFLAMPLLGWILKSPIHELYCRRKGQLGKGDSIWVMFAESFVTALEGIIIYLANTASFVRLAAYTMSHAALLMAVFAIAAELKHGVAGGIFWGLVAIILGNLVALILEGVIVAVQALRLEYYEFFGKFFSGQGQPFAPFHLTRKFIEKGAL